MNFITYDSAASRRLSKLSSVTSAIASLRAACTTHMHTCSLCLR